MYTGRAAERALARDPSFALSSRHFKKKENKKVDIPNL
jgi:hypothetical protein